MSALDGLDDRQREAARALRGPVAVLAGAGTGKTRVITHRIAHGVETGAFTPNRVMAVTFTAKAAGEMRGRLRALGVGGGSARTFHAAALSQLNYFWPTLAGDSAPAIVDNKVRLLAHAADTVGMDPDTGTLRDIASAIEWRKVTMRSIEDYATARPDGVGRYDISRIVDLQRAYEKLKDERRQLDFEDVLLACAGMLETEPAVAHAVHEQYRHFTVDEFQDVSPLQHRLLELWLGDRRDLCVVGDASQTIYSFAGADARYLLEFAHRHADATVVRLETSYRSDAGILHAANELMRGRPGALRLEPSRVPASDGAAREPEATAYEDEAAEARGIAAAVARRLRPGADPRALPRARAVGGDLRRAVGCGGAHHGARRTAILRHAGGATGGARPPRGIGRADRRRLRRRGARRAALPRVHRRGASGRRRPPRRLGGTGCSAAPGRGGPGGHDPACVHR